MISITNYLGEGVITAQLMGLGTTLSNTAGEMRGWLMLDAKDKQSFITKRCNDLIQWLKEEDSDNPKLNLKAGSFITWMKTSEFFKWRYYFLLDDKTFKGIMNDIKNNRTSKLERLTNIELSNRIHAAELIDNARTIKDLIKLVELYRDRSNMFFKVTSNRNLSGAPFQVILVGFNDLDSTIKQTVRLMRSYI